MPRPLSAAAGTAMPAAMPATILRRQAEDAIDRLLALLDDLDGDTDLEDDELGEDDDPAEDDDPDVEVDAGPIDECCDGREYDEAEHAR
jgi:hypothetical protein